MRTLIEKSTIKFNSIDKIRKYLLERVTELRKLALDENHKNPIVFMGISSICDLVSYLPYTNTEMNSWKTDKGKDLVSPRYIQFLNDYVFVGNNLNYDLGDLFYRRVRCGLDHSFSTGSGKNKQEIMVLLDHEEYGFPEEVKIKKKDKTICIGIVFNSVDMPAEKALNRMYKNVCELLIKRELNPICRELATMVILADPQEE